MAEVEGRQVRRDRDRAIKETAGERLAVVAVGHRLEQRRAEALHDAAGHLIVDTGGIDHTAAIVCDRVVEDGDGADRHVDGHDRDVAGAGETRLRRLEEPRDSKPA